LHIEIKTKQIKLKLAFIDRGYLYIFFRLMIVFFPIEFCPGAATNGEKKVIFYINFKRSNKKTKQYNRFLVFVLKYGNEKTKRDIGQKLLLNATKSIYRLLTKAQSI
jgi:hypothetical protein